MDGELLLVQHCKSLWKQQTRVEKEIWSSWQTLTFPDGMYGYNGIKSFCRFWRGLWTLMMKAKGIFSIFILTSPCIDRVMILMEKDYELDLTEGGFASFLGNRKKVLKNAMTGKILPEITRGVEWIFLHWDLITWAVNIVESDVLYSLSIIDSQVRTYPFKEEPYNLSGMLWTNLRLTPSGFGSQMGKTTSLTSTELMWC